MLSNLSEHVRLLNIIHGLNRTFSIGPQLRHAHPLTTFLEAWAALLEELRMTHDKSSLYLCPLCLCCHNCQQLPC
jgi:hypothetical protein